MCNQLLIAYELCAAAVVAVVVVLLIVAVAFVVVVVAVAFLRRRLSQHFVAFVALVATSWRRRRQRRQRRVPAAAVFVRVCVALVWVAVDVAGILESYILLQQFVLLLLLLLCSACNIVSPPFCLLNYKTNGPHINKLATRNVCGLGLAWALDGNAAHPATSCMHGMRHATRRRRRSSCPMKNS